MPFNSQAVKPSWFLLLSCLLFLDLYLLGLTHLSLWDREFQDTIFVSSFQFICFDFLVQGDIGSKTTCGSTNLFNIVQYKMFLFA